MVVELVSVGVCVGNNFAPTRPTQGANRAVRVLFDNENFNAYYLFCCFFPEPKLFYLSKKTQKRFGSSGEFGRFGNITGRNSWIPRPPVILAAAAARTRPIRLTGAVTVLCAADPVRGFQIFATLDLVGRGSFTESFPLFGLQLKDYGSLQLDFNQLV